ncbi:MAG: hypothetical protein JRF61_03635 [Deltaproteobacteria bacterium]|jgi:hypothetical protein|nr:hypothetical protein [Deltaproteobacteria bacterium]
MSLRNDYSGPFDPDLRLADFSRSFLAGLGYEYLLIGHLLDRVGQPLVAMEYGANGYLKSGIEEWMGASPIYSKRMQRLLNFEGDNVGTVFKNLQLEVGAPQQFMDFQFRLDSPDYGEFWLCHCGALLDVEKSGGEKGVKIMCHDIEDPTFDATAAATNPRMVMRPIHRPPRVDGEVLDVSGNGKNRWPHCRWAVYIAEENQPYEQHSNLAIVDESKLASIPLDVPDADAEPGGWADYSGPFDPGCQLQDFSHHALVAMNQEFAVQTHLLVRSYMLCVANHFGEEAAQHLGRRQWIGHAALGVERLQKFFGIQGDDIETLAKVFQLHPNFQPRTYIDFRIEVTGERTARITIGDCPALHEETPHGWFAQLSEEPHPAIEAIARQVNPRAICRPAADSSDGRFAWDIEIDPSAEPAEEPGELQLARLSGGMRFQFEERRLLRTTS